MPEPLRSRALGALPAGAALFPLRLFLGATFVYAGMQKLSDPGYLTPGASTYIGTQLRQFANGTPGGFVLRALAIPHPGLAGVVAALVELVIGLLVLAGWVTRPAALGGLAVNLLLFLTNSWRTHPYFLGSDIVFVFAWLPLVLAGAAGQPAADSWFARSRRRPARAGAPGVGQTPGGPRRAAGGPGLMTGLTRRAALGGGLVAAASALLVGVSLVIRSGRAAPAVSRLAQLGGPRATGGATGSQTATSSATASATSTASSSSAAGLPSGAVRLGPLSRLPVGQAAVYRDPRDGAPDLAIRASDGAVTALSAICPHAGCQVSYQPGASGGQLVCPCHGSVFDATTGAVTQGPAVTPLPTRQVVVHDGILYAVPGTA